MSDAWAGVAAYGRLTPASNLTDIERGRRPKNSSGVWLPVEPVSVASGSAAVAETTVSLPASAIAPQGVAAVLYRILVSNTGGGKVLVGVRHRAGGASVLVCESSSAMGVESGGQGWADWNGGRCTYVVVFTSSPTGVAWDISVVGFLRAA